MGRRDLILAMLASVLWIAVALPGVAQEAQPPVFATNTPMPAPMLVTTPAAALDRYALRLWQVEDLQAVLQSRVEQLAPGLSELQKVIEITQYELTRRFPDASQRGANNDSLRMAMLAAPPGSVDMRTVVRPHIEALINARVQAGAATSFEQAGFQIDMLPANLDGVSPQDAVFHVRYPGVGVPVIYEDYLPAIANSAGQYRLLTTPDLPAAPGGGALGLVLMGIGDFNGDSLDELALAMSSGDINNEMRLFGWRGDGVVNLVQPGQQLLFGQLIEGLDSSGVISVQAYQMESPEWGCLSQVDVVWRWEANFFRPTSSPASYTHQNTANCRFYEAEPIFAMPVREAIVTVNEILSFVDDPEDPGGTAGTDDGSGATRDGWGCGDGAGAGPGLAIAGRSGIVAGPANQCLSRRAGYSRRAIDPAPVRRLSPPAPRARVILMRCWPAPFETYPMQRDMPLAEQLGALGITVLDQTTLQQIGRAERQVVHFDLAGERWWAFAPLDPAVYTAEQIDPLPGNETAAAPLPVITAPQHLFDSLLVDDDPATVLAVMDNLIRENPQAAIAPDAWFLQALSLDLVGERALARQHYYDLWSRNPLSLWGTISSRPSGTAVK